jgi:polyhydroxybutyrate depolymerase
MYYPEMTQHHLIFRFAILLLGSRLWLGCAAEDSSTDERFSITFQDVNRFVHVHVPDGYSADTPVPLVVALHGAGDTGGNFQRSAGIDALADKYGFVVAYPSASTNNWAEGCNCNRPDLDGVDDVGFTDEVLNLLKGKYAIDSSRMFVIGFSQGGMFTQRLACERSEVYKGFSTVAAMISEPLSRVCRPPNTVNMLMINGTADSILPFSGIPSGSFATKGAYETLTMWKDRNECTGPINTQNFRNDSPTTLLHNVLGCPGNADLRLYEIRGGRHEWPRGAFDAPKTIVEYFGLTQ